MQQAHQSVLIQRLPIRDITALHELRGDQSIFLSITALDYINFMSNELSEIFSAILEHIKESTIAVKTSIYNILTRGLFNRLRIRDTFMQMTEVQMKSFQYRSGAVDIDDAVTKWVERTREKLISLDFHDDIRKVEVTDPVTGQKIYQIEVEQIKITQDRVKNALAMDPEKYDLLENREIKHKLKWATNADDLITKVSIVLAGFNLLVQMGAIQECESLTEASPHIVNSAGSILSIVGGIAKAEGASNGAMKSFGVIGFVLAGLESAFQAYLRYRDNDDDAMAMHTGASVSYLFAAGAVFSNVPGAIIAGLVVIAFLFSFMAAYLKDDDIAIFLKYSLWGTHYRENWVNNRGILPSWWPLRNYNLEQISSSNTPIRIGDEITKREAYLLYSQTDDDENMQANLALLSIIHQIPPFSLTCGIDSTLSGLNIYDHFTLRLEGRHFEKIERITIRLKQYRGEENNKSVYDFPCFTSNILMDNNRNKIFFEKMHSTIEGFIEHPVPLESMNEIDRARVMSTVIISSTGDIKRALGLRPWDNVSEYVPGGILENRRIFQDRKEVQCEVEITYKMPQLKPVVMVTYWNKRIFS